MALPTLKGEDARRFIEELAKDAQEKASNAAIERMARNMRKFTHDLPNTACNTLDSTPNMA